MNRLLRCMLAVIFLFAALLPVAAQTKKAAGKASDDTEFKALIERYYAAWNKGNPDAPAEFYAKDADLIFYDIAPFQYRSWAEYHDGVQKAFFDQVTELKLIPSNDLKVTRRGNVAWTTLSFHLSAKPKAGGAMELDARHTAIWERRGGKWLVVHEHISVPLPG